MKKIAFIIFFHFFKGRGFDIQKQYVYLHRRNKKNKKSSLKADKFLAILTK
jgi:hypothetical protein